MIGRWRVVRELIRLLIIVVEVYVLELLGRRLLLDLLGSLGWHVLLLVDVAPQLGLLSILFTLLDR
mgnify:CR=1 FL=1